jgi:hypothetical protein
MYYQHFTSASFFSQLKLNIIFLLYNDHADLRARPSTWFVACFIPTLGPESKWDERWGNSKAVRNTELMSAWM